SANTTLNLAAGVLTFSGASHQYLDNGSYTDSVTVTDKDGGSGQASTGVTVSNVAPSNVQLTLSAATSNENGSTTLSGTSTDPGTLYTHTVVITWGDGSSDALNLPAAMLSFSNVNHQYLSTGNYTVSVTVTDKDGGSGQASSGVTVNNVAPATVQLSLSAATINENDSTTLSGTFTDPGALDTHTV